MGNRIIAAAAFAAITAASLAGTGAARAQNFLNMDLNAMNQRFNARLNAQMAQTQNRIIQNNMSDPRLVAAWRAGVCGGGLTLQQFAYKWAATGGCTPQGYARYNATTNQINANEAATRQRYYAAQNANRPAYNNYAAGQDRIAYQRGLQLRGCQYVTDAAGQTRWYCP